MESAQRAICTLGQGQGFVDTFWCRENDGSRLRHARIDSIHTFVKKPPTGRGKLLGTPKSIVPFRTLRNHVKSVTRPVCSNANARMPLRVYTKYCFRGVSDASEAAVGYVGSPPGGDACTVFNAAGRSDLQQAFRYGESGREREGKEREGNTEQTYTVEVYVVLSSTQLPHVLSSMITYNPALYDQGRALSKTTISVC
uniref:Uncharacterized protein B11C21.060 n=1 Tax=Neurospora crassa TaxID=5141 RepID=Q871P8_NEUCS|nr:hypothetical protein [Neurospora crassa]